MAFPLGSEVTVTTLGKRGRIVEIGTKARYRVMIGALSAWCEEVDLAAAPQGGRKKRPRRANALHQTHTMGPGPDPIEARRLASLDLHGLTVPEALQQIEEYLDRAIRAGLDQVEVIHGISGGRLRAALHRYLDSLAPTVRFEIDPGNRGVTRVYF